MAKTTKTPAAAPSRPYLVTTEHRGVFFGYCTEAEAAQAHKSGLITRDNGRMCTYGEAQGEILAAWPAS